MTNPTVSVAVGDETLTLRPSLNAILAVSSTAGGLHAALERVGKLDIEAIAAVIAAGSGRTASRELMESVYRAGLLTLVGPVVDFIVLLRNGGKADAPGTPDVVPDGADAGGNG